MRGIRKLLRLEIVFHGRQRSSLMMTPCGEKLEEHPCSSIVSRSSFSKLPYALSRGKSGRYISIRAFSNSGNERLPSFRKIFHALDDIFRRWRVRDVIPEPCARPVQVFWFGRFRVCRRLFDRVFRYFFVFRRGGRNFVRFVEHNLFPISLQAARFPRPNVSSRRGSAGSPGCSAARWDRSAPR